MFSRKKAVEKKPGEPVSAAVGTNKNLEEEVRRAALRAVNRRVPVDTRKEYADGSFGSEYDIEKRKVRYLVTLRSERTGKELYAMCENDITDHGLNSAGIVGAKLGKIIADEIMREETWGSITETVQKPKKKKKKKKSVCKICGEEDRVKFPTWGPCPHEVSDD